MARFDLTQVCYAPVALTKEDDNILHGSFHYAIFGDFKLIVDKKTGFFNATHLCAQGGKKFQDWYQLDRSKELINLAEENRESFVYEEFLYQVKFEKNEIDGTYAPDDLLLEIASWISPEFHSVCSYIVLKHYINEFKEMDQQAIEKKIIEVEKISKDLIKENLEQNALLKEKEDQMTQIKNILKKQETILDQQEATIRQQNNYMRSLGISIEAVKDQNEELLEEADLLKKMSGMIQHELGVTRDIPPNEPNEMDNEQFILIKRNDPDLPPYYTIQTQESNVSYKLAVEKLHFPKLKILLNFKCNPNVKVLYNMVKKNLKSKGVVFKGNHIIVKDIITEQALMDELKAILG